MTTFIQPVPRAISALQLREALWRMGRITEAEMFAWGGRSALPAFAGTAIDAAYPEAERPALRHRALTMDELPRAHPLVGLIAAALDPDGDPDAVADIFFREASRL